MGRRRKSAAELKAAGSWRWKQREAEEKAAAKAGGNALVKLPRVPKHLNKRAADVWRHDGRLLVEAGILTAVDMFAFERYCVLQGAFDQGVENDADTNALTKLDAAIGRLAACFGLTPASRAKLTASGVLREKQADAPTSPAAKFVRLAKA